MAKNTPEHDLDLSFINEIADGSDEFIIESIDMFLVQTPDLLESINKGIAEHNWPLVASASHKLKPNLGFFGMKISQETFQEIETMAKTGSPEPEKLSAKYRSIQPVLSDTLNELAKIREKKAATL